MAESVVDTLKTVEIDGKYGEPPVRIYRLLRDQPFKGLVESHAVGQSGQRVVAGQMGEIHSVSFGLAVSAVEKAVLQRHNSHNRGDQDEQAGRQPTLELLLPADLLSVEFGCLDRFRMCLGADAVDCAQHTRKALSKLREIALSEAFHIE